MSSSFIFFFPVIAQNEQQQEFEGKKYTNTQLRDKANELIKNKNYEKALKVFDLVYFRIEDDFVKIAYCLLMLGKLNEAKNNFSDILQTARNPEIIQYARETIKYINSELREAALIKSVNDSNKDCLKKKCSWKIYYKNGKTSNQKSVPANNSDDIWRVEAQWKSGDTLNSERWIWMDKAWIGQETVFYDFKQEFIEKNLQEHREVQQILFNMYKNLDINCHNELFKALIKINTKKNDINIKNRIISYGSIIEQLNKELNKAGYYNWETPMEMKSVSQAPKRDSGTL